MYESISSFLDLSGAAISQVRTRDHPASDSDGGIISVNKIVPRALLDEKALINTNHHRNLQTVDWNQVGCKDIDGEAEWDSSGYAVSLSSDGTTVAIGAEKDRKSVV